MYVAITRSAHGVHRSALEAHEQIQQLPERNRIITTVYKIRTERYGVENISRKSEPEACSVQFTPSNRSPLHTLCGSCGFIPLTTCAVHAPPIIPPKYARSS